MIQKVPSIKKGNWLQGHNGWRYQYRDGTYPADCWVQLMWNGRIDWYRFDSRGYMRTGWFQDGDGSWYFLHQTADGTRGAMYTGWRQIGGVWYYFRRESEGTAGALLVNGITPDGFRVDGNGAWIP